jgi:hypothetical protein
MTTPDYVRVFGTLRDLEATGRKRPTWLGEELANRAIRDELLETQWLHSPVTVIQPPINGITGTTPLELPLLQAFAYRAGNEYAVMVFNLDVTTAHTVTVQVPEPPHATATLHTLSADSVRADNEASEAVSIQTHQLHDFGPAYALRLAPHSASVLVWQAAAAQPVVYVPLVIE